MIGGLDRVPARVSSNCSSRRFVSPSSTTRIFIPSNRTFSSEGISAAVVVSASPGGVSCSVTPSNEAVAMVKVNVLPCPSTLCRVTSPPRVRAMCRQIDRPSPVPPNRRVTDTSACVNGANNEGILSSAIRHARIDDFDVKQFFDGVESRQDQHSAPFREFEGVADEVQQKLPETGRIALDGFGHVSDPAGFQRDSFLHGPDRP